MIKNPTFTRVGELVTVDQWPERVLIADELLARADPRYIRRPATNQVRFVVSNGDALYEIEGPGAEPGTRALRCLESTIVPEGKE